MHIIMTHQSYGTRHHISEHLPIICLIHRRELNLYLLFLEVRGTIKQAAFSQASIMPSPFVPQQRKTLTASLTEKARRTNSCFPAIREQTSSVKITGLAVVSDLQDGLTRRNLLDFEVISSSQERIPTSRFLLMCRSSVFEEQLRKDASVKELELSNYTSVALNAAMEYLASNELPFHLLISEDAGTMRVLVQVSYFGEEFKVDGLYEEAFRRIRILMVKIPPLSLVAYDVVKETAAEENMEETMEEYALQIIQDKPFETLQSTDQGGPGIQHLRPSRILALLKNQSLQIPEVDFFQALLTWYEITGDMDHAKMCASNHIALRFIEPSELMTTVKDSEFFDSTLILEAMADQALEAQLEGKQYSNYRGLQAMERVVVKNAGIPDVNGVYIRQSRDDFRDYEALYLKPSVRSLGEYGLYFWNNVWNIAPAMDLSNIRYFCESEALTPPKVGWQVCPNGEAPEPICRFLKAREVMTRHGEAGHASLPRCFRNSFEFLGN